MTTRNLTTIALRFFALIWTLKALALLAAFVTSLRLSTPYPTEFIDWVLRVLPVFIGIGFWLVSGTIARLACFGCDTPLPVTELREFVLYRITFLGAGLWAVLTSAGELATWLHYYAKMQRTGEEQILSADLYEMASFAITFALGLGLVLSSHVWAKKACRVHQTVA